MIMLLIISTVIYSYNIRRYFRFSATNQKNNVPAYQIGSPVKSPQISASQPAAAAGIAGASGGGVNIGQPPALSAPQRRSRAQSLGGQDAAQIKVWKENVNLKKSSESPL